MSRLFLGKSGPHRFCIVGMLVWALVSVCCGQNVSAKTDRPSSGGTSVADLSSGSIDRPVVREGRASSAEMPQTRNRKISGVILDSDGNPVIGAAIGLQEGDRLIGAVSDIDGRFELEIPDGTRRVNVTCLGYADQTVNILEDKDSYSIVMRTDSEFLDEVVIVAFGTQKKETVTGAISMVQTKELVQSPQANVSNMLVGRLPGLLAVQRSGEPGEDASTLRIRGVGTFATGEGSQEPLVMVDGIETDNFNNIDPNEIESLSILKDASSTAVYGVRGANGVILITTKRGNEGKPVISYSANFAINQFTDIRETMNAYEYTTSFNEARRYDAYISGGYTPRYTDDAIRMYWAGADPVLYPDVDWYDLMLKKSSFTTQHNVNVSGGAKRVKYFISAGYYNQQGLFDQTSLMEGYDVQSAYERFNFRSNLDFEVTKRLSIKLNISTQIETRTGNAGNTASLMDAIARANPVVSPGIVDGKIVTLGTSTDNPMKQFYQNGSKNDHRNHLNGSVNVRYHIPGVEGLYATATFSYENYYTNIQKYVKNPLMTYSVFRNSDYDLVFQPQTTEKPFSFSQSFGKYRRTYLEAGLNYTHTFGDGHNVTALLLYNQSRRVDPNLEYKVPNSYQGIVGRITYDYKNRYLLEFNVGYNGTENFAEGKRFGLFPAYSVGWVLTEEPFYPKNDILTFFKVRASYGEVGNDRIGGARFLYLPTAYVSGGQYHFGQVGSSYTQYAVLNEGQIGNPALTWERAKKTNVGVEMTLWKSRIRVAADWFLETRDNILTERKSYATLYGGIPAAVNMGRMRNSGFEIDATFRNTSGAFTYWLRGNYTFARNIIEFMDESPTPYPYKYKTGQSLGQYYGLICDGIYNTWEEVNDPNRPESSWQNDRLQPGDLIYRDVNGDGVIDDNDQVPIGYSNFPEVVYGISLGLEWKGLDFSILFQGAANVSLQYSRYYTRGFGEDFSAPRYLLDESWTWERYVNGETINYPHLSEGDVTNKHNYQNSTFWTRDASYIRLKNLEIGYTFSGRLLKAAKISSARIFVNGNNLFTWSHMLPGIDPEVGQQATNQEAYPVTKTYNIGFTIKF